MASKFFIHDFNDIEIHYESTQALAQEKNNSDDIHDKEKGRDCSRPFLF